MMEQDLLAWVISNFKVLVLVIVRIGSLLFLMPVFSSRALPLQIKAAATIVLAIMLVPVVPFRPDQLPADPVSFGVLAVSEMFVGMTLALILRLLFAGIQIAGQMVGFQMGFSVANIVDPHSGTQSVIISQLAYLITLLLFLGANGHYLILEALHESFVILSPGSITLSAPLSDIILDLSREMFVLSIKLMAPAMAILVLAQVALGILAKTVPQINMLIMSFGLNIALGLFFIGISMQVFWPVLERSLAHGFSLMPVAMHLLAGE